MKFKFLEHTADTKFQAFGSTIEKAFENSALALKEAIAGKIKIKDKVKKTFIVEGKDKERILYNFLEEILFLLDAEGFILNKAKCKFLNENKLKVEVWGDSAKNYKFTNEVKAVTYNEMFVKKEKKNKFICQVVLDT